MSDVKKALGKKIKQIRKSKNFTQEELAELIDIEIPSLSNIETGKFAPSAETLQKLSLVLNTPIWEFYYFDVLTNQQMTEEIMGKIQDNPELTKVLYNFLKAIE